MPLHWQTPEFCLLPVLANLLDSFRVSPPDQEMMTIAFSGAIVSSSGRQNLATLLHNLFTTSRRVPLHYITLCRRYLLKVCPSHFRLALSTVAESLILTEKSHSEMLDGILHGAVQLQIKNVCKNFEKWRWNRKQRKGETAILEEKEKAKRMLKNGKSPGVDNIPAKILIRRTRCHQCLNCHMSENLDQRTMAPKKGYSRWLFLLRQASQVIMVQPCLCHDTLPKITLHGTVHGSRREKPRKS